jgi:hypothetical protein
MEGDPAGDLLWGLLLVVGFFVVCVIVLGGSS